MSLPRHARAGILAFAAFVGGSCLAPEPTPEDWLGYGFRRPEDTFRAFLTALAGDRPELEYRCLSNALKKREGGNLLGYLVLRDQLFDDMPWLKAAARAEVEEVEYFGPDLAQVTARVDWLFWDEVFTVVLVREEYYELRADGELVGDDYYPFEPVNADGYTVIRVPAAEDFAPDELSEVRLGREWKIDGIPLQDQQP
ncbi:MAG: hypothetical protein AAF682_18690 [Planctomycetota bacterium]